MKKKVHKNINYKNVCALISFTKYNTCKFQSVLALLFFVCLTTPSLAQPDGSLDTTFNSGDAGFYYGTGVGGTHIVLQPDGKIITSGFSCVRLFANGDIDSSFTIANLSADCMVRQADGKLVAGGHFTQYQGQNRNCILRMDSIGNLDTTFNPGTGFDYYVKALALQTDGKILAGGWFSMYNNDTIRGIIRLNTDGTRDTSFHNGFSSYAAVQAIVIQPDGKIIIGGGFSNYDSTVIGNIARLNTNGSLDTTFQQGTGFPGGGAQSLSALALQPDGKIIAGGFFWYYNGVQVTRSIIRINTDGTRDATFGYIGIDDGPVNQTVLTIALLQDGKILVGGGFQLCDSVLSNCIVRLDTNGVLDTTFNTGSGFNWAVHHIIVLPNGQSLVTGDFSYYNKFGRNNIIKLNIDGSPDTSFFINTGFNSWVSEVALQPDGKILAMGWFSSYNNTPYFSVARILPDGSPDTSFHQHNTEIRMMSGNLLIQPDGKILISGWLWTPITSGIARLNTDGSLDATFSSATAGGGTDSPIALQPDGKIISGFGTKWLTRLNNDGSVDSAFYNNLGTGFDTYPNYFALQADGKIVAVGEFNSFDGHACGKIARINADGTCDSTFNIGTGFDSWGADVVTIQPDGKIIVGGDFNQFNGSTQRGIVRLNSDGSRDSTFVTGSGISSYVKSIIVQPDGKIIVGGYYSSYNGYFCNSIARLNSNGSYDNTFISGSGFDGWVTSQALQPDGKLVIVGSFGSYNGIGRNRIARLNSFNSTGVETLNELQSNVSIYPNPTSDFLTITNSENKTPSTIFVKDVCGKIVLRKNAEDIKTIMDVRKLNAGIYFVTVETKNQTHVKKLIKQ